MNIKIYGQLIELLKKTNREHLFDKLLSPALEYFADYEYRGIAIDEEVLQSCEIKILEKLNYIEKTIIIEANVSDLNIASGKQLINLFFGILDGLKLYPLRKTDTGQPCLNAETLEEMQSVITIELLNRHETT